MSCGTSAQPSSVGRHCEHTTSSAWYFLNSGKGQSAFNMALDEALVEALPQLGRPVLRFYGWIEPAVSFGYFQKYADIELLTRLRPLVRRPTGGGLVSHEEDWTYSVAFPASHEWYGLAAVESYRRIHHWIQTAFARLDVGTELAPAAQGADLGQCFAGYSQFDVLWRGRKIAGAAQRRRREGLLIQGSVQPPLLSLVRADWERAMCAAARLQYGAEWLELELNSALKDRALTLAAQKYLQSAFTRRR
jgi:lipoyl(octanoyl) transferase